MALESFANDTIEVHKANGDVAGPYKAVVSRDSITIFDKSADIDAGDLIVRLLPGGKKDQREVTDVHFQTGLGGIPSHWTVKSQKPGTPKKMSTQEPLPPPAVTNITINNSTGIQVGDHNIAHFESAINSLIEQINKVDAPEGEKIEAKSRIARLLEHPLVASLVGGIVTKALGA